MSKRPADGDVPGAKRVHGDNVDGLFDPLPFELEDSLLDVPGQLPDDDEEYDPVVRRSPVKRRTIPSAPAPKKVENKAAEDPLKLNDALAAAGVDIAKEEELLTLHRPINNTSMAQQLSQRYRQLGGFLYPYHVSQFMSRVARDNGIVQNFSQETELLDLMSSACHHWLLTLITKTVLLSRHRRRGIPNINKKDKKAAMLARLELSKELRNLAAKQKEQEEKRVTKRMLLGLEKSDGLDGAKAGADETLHRATNSTAALMTSARKKYSWMTSTGGASSAIAHDDGKSKQSSILSARGDNGLRFREIRAFNSITMKDFLAVIEDERMGVEKAIIKGYAKLKD